MINYLQSISLSTKSFPSFNICRGEEITSSLLNIYIPAEDTITHRHVKKRSKRKTIGGGGVYFVWQAKRRYALNCNDNFIKRSKLKLVLMTSGAIFHFCRSPLEKSL